MRPCAAGADAPGPDGGGRAGADLAALQAASQRIERKIDRMMAQWGCPPLEAASLFASSEQEAVPCEPSAREPSAQQAAGAACAGGAALPSEACDTESSASDKSKFGNVGTRFVASTLPLNWPQTLSTRGGWKGDRVSVNFSADPKRARTGLLVAEGDDLRGLAHVEAAWYMLDPSGRLPLCWGVLALLVLMYDLTLTPYVLAWTVPFEGWLRASAWTTPAFWTLDIALNFLTGFWRGGELVMDPRQSAINYLRTWFLCDAAVVSCDWASLLIDEIAGASGGQGFKMLRFTKLGRTLRIVGMLKMVRFLRIVDRVARRHLAEGSHLTVTLASLFSCILWVAHVLACAWYAVGRYAASDTGAHWTFEKTVSVGTTSIPYLESGSLYQYMVTFHWAASQIALGALDIMPTNSVERFVFVLAMMTGFLFGSALVSTLSAAMMDFHFRQRDKKHKTRTLHQYLRENEVHRSVAVPVQRQVWQRLAQGQKLQEDEVPALAMLSVTLKSALRFNIQRPHLMPHPMFRLWIGLDAQMMQRVCMAAVGFVQLRQNDDLFTAGGAARSAYALTAGELSYTQHPDTSAVGRLESSGVRPGTWLCEAALWTEWIHVGRAEALTSCSVLEIDGEKLADSVSKNMIIMDIATEYCKHFVRRVNAAGPPHAPWPNDLEVPFTDYCDLVFSMKPDVQVTIGVHAVGLLAKHGSASNASGSKALEKLSNEVHVGKSIVVVTGEGNIIRVVSLVALRVQRADGYVFAQVAKWEDSKMNASCQLPGFKQDRDELVGEAIRRLFSTNLELLADKVTITGTVRETAEMNSKEYGVHTRYLKSICSARLHPDASVDAPRCGVLEASRASRTSDLSVGIDLADADTLAFLQSLPVFAPGSPGDDLRSAYAWLPPELFSSLSSGGKDQLLSAWVASLTLPEDHAAGPSAEQGEGLVRGRV